MPQKPLSYLFIAAQTQYMTQTAVQIQVQNSTIQNGDGNQNYSLNFQLN